MNQFVIVIGNPIDGISLYGPFDDIEEAHEWAENNSDEWWCAMLYEPKAPVQMTGTWNSDTGVFTPENGSPVQVIGTWNPEDDSVFGPM